MVPDRRRLATSNSDYINFVKKEVTPGQQHGHSIPGLRAAGGHRLEVDLQLGGVPVTLENATMLIMIQQMREFTSWQLLLD